MYPHNPYFGIAPQYYGFVGIAPMAPMAIPPPPVATIPPVITTPAATAVVAAVPEIPLQYVREKPPVTTVFVGNIAECAPDQLIKTLLMRCGNILSWKRVQGASGKLQAFGFCEYEDPESTMRCVRLLNGFKVGPKPLLVKVDPKTEDLLNEYRKKKEKVGEEGTLGATSEEVDQSTQRDDETVKAALENIIAESASLLEDENGGKKQDLHLEGPRHLTIEDMDLDSDRKDLINREIESFRKRNEKEDQNDTKQPRSKVSNSGRPGLTTMQIYSAYAERVEREYRRERTRRSRSRSSSLASSRSRGPITSSFVISSKDIDEEEEAIKKKLEKKLREKEESYQKRLKQWEVRERKRANEYEHEREHEKKRQRELQIEAQRLKEFFEDYDDNIEDPKYYRGSALHQRLKDREVEEAADDRDRQKEVEQLETARRKLIEEGDPNAESIIFQMEQKMQEHLRKCLHLDGDMSIDSIEDNNQCVEPVSQNMSNAENESKDTECMVKSLETNNLSPARNGVTSEFEPAAPEETGVSMLKDGTNTFLFSMSTVVEPVVRKSALAFTDEDQDEKPKKHGLSWLPPSALKANSMTNNSNGTDAAQNDPSNLPPVSALSTEEKKAIIKKIIEGIPTHKRELFAYPIDWDMVDAEFVNSRIKPWVDKKIVSYIGEAEATLSNFICDQLLHHNPPERILADIAMVLDEEAEVFVVKMWRLLIYVIAEKKAGLSS
ncbi:unnamed protein product [Trichobilharzia szidati]|nr:unnamed protein product [Trichobilharzia szidati]